MNMATTQTTISPVEKYTISDETAFYNSILLYRKFVIYDSENEYIYAFVKYNCAELCNYHDYFSEKKMKKCILLICQHIQRLMSINEITFKDYTHIPTNIPLYHLSIAFNGQTWYEKHFNARQSDSEKHALYRKTVDELLYSDMKQNSTFHDFLIIAQVPSLEIIHELHEIFKKTTTYNEFFQAIPYKNRCQLWVSTFIRHYLSDTFSNNGWIIDIQNMSTIKSGKKSYSPRRKINYDIIYNTSGLTIDDV